MQPSTRRDGGRSKTYAQIADGLREAIADHSERVAPSALGTYAEHVPRRAEPLATLAKAELGVPEVSGLRVADLGCGFGSLSTYFAWLGAQVQAVDRKDDRLEIGRSVAEAYDLEVEFHHANLRRLPLADGSSDLALLNNSLCYIVDPTSRAEALGEALRILRPGGVALLRNPNRTYLFRDPFSGLPLVNLLPPRAARTASRLARRDRSFVRLTTASEGLRELRRAGFTEVSARRVAATGGRGVPTALLRYQHLVARRPRSS